jgi:hypothetical protein
MVINSKKKGQVTIFIILAILLIIIALAIFYFIPKLKTSGELDVKNPNTYFQSCMESSLEDTLTTIGLQGGSMEPEFYKSYEGEKVEYLCYTENKNEACDILRPFLEDYIVSEIKKELTPVAQECYNELITIYQAKGYSVTKSSTNGELIIELLPGKVKLSFLKDLTLTKTDTQKYSSFSVVSNNNLYELVSIASNIITWKSLVGNIDPTSYEALYHDLKIEKNNPRYTDGTEIYILTDKKYETKFQFAVRSWVLSVTY